MNSEFDSGFLTSIDGSVPDSFFFSKKALHLLSFLRFQMSSKFPVGKLHKLVIFGLDIFDEYFGNVNVP